MIVRCSYEGFLITNRMITIRLTPSSDGRTDVEEGEKLQAKIEFKFL